VDYFGQNGYLETFIERIFEKKISRKLVALRSIMALKKDSRTSYFKSKEPHPKLKRPFHQYEVLLAKKINTKDTLSLYGSVL